MERGAPPNWEDIEDEYAQDSTWPERLRAVLKDYLHIVADRLPSPGQQVLAADNLTEPEAEALRARCWDAIGRRTPLSADDWRLRLVAGLLSQIDSDEDLGQHLGWTDHAVTEADPDLLANFRALLREHFPPKQQTLESTGAHGRASSAIGQD